MIVTERQPTQFHSHASFPLHLHPIHIYPVPSKLSIRLHSLLSLAIEQRINQIGMEVSNQQRDYDKELEINEGRIEEWIKVTKKLMAPKNRKPLKNKLVTNRDCKEAGSANNTNVELPKDNIQLLQLPPSIEANYRRTLNGQGMIETPLISISKSELTVFELEHDSSRGIRAVERVYEYPSKILLDYSTYTAVSSSQYVIIGGSTEKQGIEQTLTDYYPKSNRVLQLTVYKQYKTKSTTKNAINSHLDLLKSQANQIKPPSVQLLCRLPYGVSSCSCLRDGANIYIIGGYLNGNVMTSRCCLINLSKAGDFQASRTEQDSTERYVITLPELNFPSASCSLTICTLKRKYLYKTGGIADCFGMYCGLSPYIERLALEDGSLSTKWQFINPNLSPSINADRLYFYVNSHTYWSQNSHSIVIIGGFDLKANKTNDIVVLTIDQQAGLSSNDSELSHTIAVHSSENRQSHAFISHNVTRHQTTKSQFILEAYYDPIKKAWKERPIQIKG